MNRSELTKAVAAHTGMDHRDVDAALRGFTDVVTAVVAKGEPVTMTGFAKFSKVDRPARMGRNPATGAQIRIKASKKVRLAPLKTLKDAVQAPSTAPKLAKGVWPPAPAAASTSKAATKKAAAAKKASAKKAGARKAAPARKSASKAPAKRTAAKKAGAAKKKSTAKKAGPRKRT